MAESDPALLKEMQNYYGHKLFKCSQQGCPRAIEGYDNPQDRFTHMQCHEKPFKCSETSCEYSHVGFPSKTALLKHKVVHTETTSAMMAIARLNLAENVIIQSPIDPLDIILDAIANDDVDTVTKVLEQSTFGDTYLKSDRNGGIEPGWRFDTNPLIFTAAENGSFRIVSKLLELGSPAGLKGKPVQGHQRTTESWKILTPLSITKSLVIFRALIIASSDPARESRDPFWEQVLSGARFCPDALILDKLAILQGRGVRFDVHQNGRNTPLSMACFYGLLNVVHWLIDLGENVNGSSTNADAPLMTACNSTYRPPARAKIVEALMFAGANPLARTARGGTKMVGAYAFIKQLPKHIYMTWEELLEATRSKREPALTLTDKPISQEMTIPINPQPTQEMVHSSRTTPMFLNEDQTRLMDEQDCPATMLNSTVLYARLPQDIKSWKSLKSWVAGHPNLFPSEILGKLKRLQALHYHSLISQQSKAVQQNREPSPEVPTRKKDNMISESLVRSRLKSHLTEGELRYMDQKEFSPKVVSQVLRKQGRLPPDTRTWLDLKCWAANNSHLCVANVLQKLEDLQALHHDFN